MMNIAIVDDEKCFLSDVHKQIEQVCNDNNIDNTITLINDPYMIIENKLFLSYDVIILDIEMPNISGVEIASIINSEKGDNDNPYIIFLTNKESLVFEALKEQPYSFVRKSNLEDIIACLNTINRKLKTEQIVHIKSGRNIYRILINDIIYLEKEKNYVIYHTKTATYRERTTIDDKIKEFKDNTFLRPHIGYLVNMRYIQNILATSIQLTNGVLLPLSKKYRKDTKYRFFNWLVNKK